MEDKDKLPQKWINTPFAFTKFSKNLSLLQQEILLKVSERLQPFIEEFFGNEELYRNHKKPKALFSEAAKNSGIMNFDISYAELGVAINNFFAAKEAARKVLDLKVSAPGVGEDGKVTIRDYNIFSFSEMSASNDRVVFSLNTDMVDYVFDMTEKYVSHPDNIAYIGTVDRMPMIYYLLRRACENKWKPEVKLTVAQIKDYLGMVEYADGQLVKEAYPKFSQFKKKVLDTSINDINRLKKEGLLDVCITYTPCYKGARKVGNPFYIKFNIYQTIEEMQKATAAEAWNQFLNTYNGMLRQYFFSMKFLSCEGNALLLEGTNATIDAIDNGLRQNAEEGALIQDAIKKTFGIAAARLRYKVSQ